MIVIFHVRVFYQLFLDFYANIGMVITFSVIFELFTPLVLAAYSTKYSTTSCGVFGSPAIQTISLSGALSSPSFLSILTFGNQISFYGVEICGHRIRHKLVI